MEASDARGLTPRDSDTIVALATPPGQGALHVIRLSGGEAHRIASQVAKPWPKRPRAIVRVSLTSAGGEHLDDATIIRYDAPASYTGEDAAEIICHGGSIVAGRVIGALTTAGARPAERGEFTRRAFLHGKLDLLQAEAVNELINAESSVGAQRALRQLDGNLSRRILELREQVVGLEALIAYDIDFPEEDDGPVPDARIAAETEALMAALRSLIDTSPAGELMRAGAVVAIAGPPNAGKSSLFNALIGRERAIVTEVPGTTRDALEALLDTSPFPLRLVDTAGLRPTRDIVEQIGVQISRDYLKAADIVLACGESTDDIEATWREAAAQGNNRIVRVRTKSDLGGSTSGLPGCIAVSALRGTGLRELVEDLQEMLAQGTAPIGLDMPVITNARHRRALERALEEVEQFAAARRDRSLPATIAAVHLRSAAGALEELIGGVDVEDILTRVFSAFCVGK